ncbi:Glucosamine-6-phosphate deaminase [uncultured archaeon]|nr:Glucosamine-6-phosphate deaminase [uncultured archaeon]
MLIGFPGGHSLDGFYAGLGPLVSKEQRAHLLFFPVDERVGASDKESNGKALRKALCDCGLANPEQVLAPLCEGMADSCLKAYGRLLRTLAPEGADLLILGVGEDGHVASLFPNKKEIAERGDDWLLVSDAPKPPPKRITLPPSAILKAKEVWLVFRGQEKKEAWRKFNDARSDAKDCPAKLVLKRKGPTVVWADLE